MGTKGTGYRKWPLEWNGTRDQGRDLIYMYMYMYIPAHVTETWEKVGKEGRREKEMEEGKEKREGEREGGREGRKGSREEEREEREEEGGRREEGGGRKEGERGRELTWAMVPMFLSDSTPKLGKKYWQYKGKKE